MRSSRPSCYTRAIIIFSKTDMNVRFSSFIKTTLAAALALGTFAASSASAAVYFPLPVPEVTVAGGSTYTVTTGTQTVISGGGQQTQTINTMPVEKFPMTVINIFSTAATTTIYGATSTVVIISGPASSTLGVATTSPFMVAATTTASSAPAEVITTNYTFTKNLSFGSRGKDVTELQKMLINLNFKITYPQTGDMAVASGVFDAQTRNALVAFQKQYGIVPAIGFFGPITRALVNGWAK